MGLRGVFRNFITAEEKFAPGVPSFTAAMSMTDACWFCLPVTWSLASGHSSMIFLEKSLPSPWYMCFV